MDLRAEVGRTGVRRLYALITGLPLDAAVWREEKPSWTLDHELAALLIERVDDWGAALAQILTQKKGRISLPAAMTITHPDRPVRVEPAQKRIETDPDVIRDFFARNLGGEEVTSLD